MSPEKLVSFVPHAHVKTAVPLWFFPSYRAL
jgi:hypothetical protein